LHLPGSKPIALSYSMSSELSLLINYNNSTIVFNLDLLDKQVCYLLDI
jgi:hypothetical protein